MNKDELQQLAQRKELEWKEINEKRIEALEQEFKATVKALEQEKRNFGELKEDFKYNLKLLEERDKELANIESYYSVLKKQQSDKDAIISELKIEIDEFKKVLEREKSNQDEAKRFYLERLNEKQHEFENYRQMKDNEVKKERSEIENLKRGLQNHVESLKYDLERQKSELKNEFDEVMRKREHEWRKAFDEQGTEMLAKELQVKLLTNELEQIKETNKRLQCDYDDTESKYKKLERGMKEKDWELKDNVSLKDAKIQDLEARLREMEGNTKRQCEELKCKLEKMDKVVREKDLQIQALKECRGEHEKEKRNYEDRIKDLQSELEHKERSMEKFIDEKGQMILNLTEDVLRLKSGAPVQPHNEVVETTPVVAVEATKLSYQELKAENNDLRTEKKLHLKYLADYKLKLERALEREQQLEQEKTQIGLDWQKRYQELENTKYTTSEEYLNKLSDSRDQAVAQVRSLEERMKQKEAILNAMKAANPTLDALNTEVYESTCKEENEYLKQIIKQMRGEIETLANQLPQKESHNYTSKSKSPMTPRTTNNNDSGLVLNTKTFDNTIINDHVESLNQKVSMLRKEKLELTSYMKKQQIRVMHLEKSVSSVNEQLHAKQSQIETLQYEVNSQTRRHTTETNSLKQRIGELELELNESHKEADEYHKNVIQKESEIAGLELKISELKLKLSSSGTQINFGAQELFIQQLQDEIQRLNEKMLNQNESSSGNRSSTMVDGVTVNEMNYVKEIKDLKGKLKSLAKTLSQLIHEKQQLIEMSNQLRAELEKTRRQYDEIKFKKFNKENYIDEPHLVDHISPKVNQLKKLEDIQYNLTKKDLAFANLKSNAAQSHPNLVTSDSTGSKTTVSSVGSENLQELWKILDENPQRDETSRSTNQQKHQIESSSLSARGEKKPIQSKQVTSVINRQQQKPKIRNYNIKDDN